MAISAGDTQARSRFQNGLLTWLRPAAPQDHANGLREMIAVTRALADPESLPGGDGLLWRSAGSFLQALLDGTLSPDDEARGLCRRLERQLASRSTGQATNDSADSLANAIFAFVSNRLPGRSELVQDPASPAGDEPEPGAARLDGGAAAMLANTFSATADVLPLLGNARTRRFDDAQLTRWKAAVATLRREWHAVQTAEQADCRAASIALLQLALEVADPPSLKLAEAFAEAAGAAEDPAILVLPAFRAAFAAALEVAEHSDGPDQKGFDNTAAAMATRLSRAAQLPRTAVAAPGAGSPWFAEDARESLAEMAAALDAVPPDRPALLAGFDWFVQHESGKVMAIRGLATTAHKVISQIRSDDLDEVATHAILGRSIGALQRAVSDLAAGVPPRADEDVFAELRALDQRVTARRQQAIAAARAASEVPPPANDGAPLQ